jgi:hypothetical protein
MCGMRYNGEWRVNANCDWRMKVVNGRMALCGMFQEDYKNSKRQMRGNPIHASRDVQKSVQGDGKRNEHN